MKLQSVFKLLGLCAFFSACSSIPDDVKAIKPFDKSKYLGKWYEIARFDFKFERGLELTTAEYSIKDNGTIKVVNRGYNKEKKEWSEAVGKAKFAGPDTVAMLKVSFFGPFYGGYNVIALDQEYQYALVCGGSKDYLWILSREKQIPETIKTSYLHLADSLGFATEKLLWINQDSSKAGL